MSAFTRKTSFPRSARRRRDAFGLEPLEARLLLSADPVLGAAQIVLAPPAHLDHALVAAYDPHAADVAHAGEPVRLDAAGAGAQAVSLPPGDGALHIAPAAGSAGAIVLGDLPGDGAPPGGTTALQLGSSALAQLQEGAQRIVVGRAGDSNPIVLGSAEAGGLHFSDDVELYSNGHRGEVFILGDVTAPSLTIHGSGHTTTLSADVTMTASDYTMADSMRVNGAHTITAAHSIVLGEAVVTQAGQSNFVGGDPNTPSGDRLTLSAGANVTFNGMVAAGLRESSDTASTDLLNGITVTHAVDVLFNNSVALAGDLRIANASGNVDFKGAVTLSGGGADLVIGADAAGTAPTVHDVVFEEAVTLDGNLIINASGDVTFKRGVTITGGGDLIIRGAHQVYFTTSSGVTLSGVAGSHAGDAWIQADEIDLSMAESAFRGQGTVTLLPTTRSEQIAAGSPLQAGTEGVLNLEASELRTLADGWSQIVIGHGSSGVAATGTGAVLVGAHPSGPLWRDDVTVYGDSITVTDFNDTGTVLRLAAGETLTLAAVHDITLVNEVEAEGVTLRSSLGQVVQAGTDFDSDGRTGEALRTRALTVEADTGVTLSSLEVSTLDVVNHASGDIALALNVARNTAMFNSAQITGDVSVLRLAQTSAGDAGGIGVLARGGSITLPGGAGTAGIAVAGSGAVTLEARGTGEDIVLANAIAAAGGGAVTLTSADAIAMAATAVISGGRATLAAQGGVTLGLIDVSGAIVVGSASGAIADGIAGSGLNLRGASAALQAAQGIGAAEPAGTAAGGQLRTSLDSLTAINTTGGGLYVTEADGLTLAGVTLGGSAAGSGVLSVTALAGDLAVTGDLVSSATGTGSGQVLLDAQAGALALAAQLATSVGNISLSAAGTMALGASTAVQVRTLAAGQTIDVRAGAALSMASSAALVSSNGAQRLQAGGAVTLGLLDAGTAAVGVRAAGAVSDANGAAVNVRAGSLRLQAGGSAGSGADALETAVAQVAAEVGGGLYLSEADGLEIGSADIAVQRVQADGTLAAGGLADAALLGSSAGGDIVVVNGTAGDGALLVSQAVTVTGSGNVRLEAGRASVSAPGSLTLGAAIDAGSGAVTLLAQGEIVQTAAGDVSTAGGTVDVQSVAGAVTMADGAVVASGGGTVRYAAAATLTVGRIDADSGDASLLAGGSILDNATEAVPGSVDVRAGRLRLEAGGAVGDAADALETDVATLAAVSADGIFIAEADDLAVGDVAITGSRVGLDGVPVALAADAAVAGLSTTADGSVVLQAGGALTLDQAVSAGGSGNVLLRSDGAALAIDAAVASGSGHVSLIAAGALALSAAGDVTTAGSADLQAGGAVAMASSSGSDETVVSADGGVRVQALGGDLTLGRIVAGTDGGGAGVALVAAGSIVDGDAGNDVTAGTLWLSAGQSIGSGADALDIAVGTLALNAAGGGGLGGAFVSEAAGLDVGAVIVSVQRVDVDASTAAASTGGEDLNVTGGALVLTALAGDLRLGGGSATPSAAVASHGGAVRLEAAAGALALDAALDTGALTLLARDDITQSAAAGIVAAGPVDVQSSLGAVTMADGATIVTAIADPADVRVAAGASLTLGRIDAGSEGHVSLLAGGAIVDNPTEAVPGTVDVRARELRLSAGGAIGAGANALETEVATLSVRAAGGVFVTESDALTVGTTAASSGSRVGSDGTPAALPADAAQSGIVTTANGALVLASGGALTVDQAVTLGGSGNLLLQTQGGAVAVNAALTSGSGHLSIVAAGALTLAAAGDVTTGGAGSIDLQAGGALTLAANNGSDETVITSGGKDVRLQALGGDLQLGRIVAGADSASAGKVVLRAAGRILDGDAGNDVTAGALWLSAGQAIGGSADALEIAVDRLALETGAGGAFVSEAASLNVNAVAASLNRVGSDGTTTLLTAGGEDLRSSGGGALVLTVQSGRLSVFGGTATPALAVSSGGGALRLQAVTGALEFYGGLDAGTGDVTLLAKSSITQGASGDIATSGTGTVDVQSVSGAITMEDGARTSAAGNVRYAAQSSLMLGEIEGGAAVSLLAARIGDSGTADVDVTAQQLRLQTTGLQVGDGAGSAAQALQVHVGTLAAALAGGGGLFLAAADDLVVSAVGAVSVRRVALDATTGATVGDALLSDVVTTAGPVILTAAGTLTVQEGDADPGTLGVQAGGAVLLRAGVDLLLEADVRAGSGAMTLAAGRDLRMHADVLAQGGAMQTTVQTIDLSAGGGLVMDAGSVVRTTAAGGAIRLAAQGSVTLGVVDAGAAGSVAVSAAAGDVIDADAAAEGADDGAVNVVAGQARLWASGSIGAAGNRIEIALATLAAQAGGDLHVTQNDGLEIGTVTVTVQQVQADATTAALTEGALAGLAAGGELSLAVQAGDLSTAAAVQAGGPATLSASGNLSLADGLRAGGPATLSSGGDMSLVGGVQAGGSATFDAAGNLSFADGLHAGGSATLASGQDMLLAGDGQAAGAATLSAGGSLSLEGGLHADGSLTLTSGHDLSLAGGVLAGGPATLSAAGNLSLVDGLQAGELTLTSGHDLSLAGNVQADGPATLDAAGTLSLAGSVQATDAATLSAGGAIVSSAGAVVGARQLHLFAGGAIGSAAAHLATAVDVLDASAGAGIFIDEADALRVERLSAGGDLVLGNSAGDLVLGQLGAAGNARLSAFGSLVGAEDVGIHLSALAAQLSAGGAITLSTAVRTLSAQAGGDVSITERDDILVESLLTQGRASVRSLSGTVTFAGALDGHGQDIALVADNLELRQPVSSVGAELSIRPADPTRALVVGDAPAAGEPALYVGPATLSLLQDGFSRIVLGSGSAVGQTVRLSGVQQPVEFHDPVRVEASGAGSRIVLQGAIGAEAFSLQGPGHGTDAIELDLRVQDAIDIDDGLRLAGRVHLGSATGDITLRGAVDGQAGGAADVLVLDAAGGNVRVLGAVGAVQTLDGLQVAHARDITFEQGVTVHGDVTLQASGSVTFDGALALGTGSLHILGATRVVLGDVVLGASGAEVVITTDALALLGVVTGSNASLRLSAASAGGGLVIGASGGTSDGTGALQLDAGQLSRLQGFAEVVLGRADGAASVEVDALAALDSAQLRLLSSSLRLAGSETAALGQSRGVTFLAGGDIAVQGRVALSGAGADLVLDSAGSISMAATALLSTAGGEATLRAQGDVSVGQVDTHGGGAVLISREGSITRANTDDVVNVHAGWVALRGHGPRLGAGESSSPQALRVSAARVDVDAGHAYVLRDSDAAGHTFFNVLEGGVLYQALVAEGAPLRTASGPQQDGTGSSNGAEAATQGFAAWMAGLQPGGQPGGQPHALPSATPAALERSNEAAQALRSGSWAAAAGTDGDGNRTAAYLEALTRAAEGEENVQMVAARHAGNRPVTYWEEELVL